MSAFLTNKQTYFIIKIMQYIKNYFKSIHLDYNIQYFYIPNTFQITKIITQISQTPIFQGRQMKPFIRIHLLQLTTLNYFDNSGNSPNLSRATQTFPEEHRFQ